MFGRTLLGLAPCLAAVEEDGGAGGSAPAPPAPSPPPKTPPPTVDPEKVKAEARLAVLKDLGFDSEDAYKVHLDEKKKAEDAKLSELDRQKKLYNEALDARGKAEAKYEAEKAARKAAEDALALRDRLDAQGVLPGERKFVQVELSDAEAAAKKAGQAFDEAKFFKQLRERRPYFFTKDAPQPATTGTSALGGNASHGSNGASNGLTFDASKLSAEEWKKWRQEHNV
jgi:hypothetical protein